MPSPPKGATGGPPGLSIPNRGSREASTVSRGRLCHAVAAPGVSEVAVGFVILSFRATSYDGMARNNSMPSDQESYVDKVPAWRTNPLRRATDVLVQWMPLSSELHRSVVSGISDAGQLVYFTADGLIVVNESCDYMGLLPFLELQLPAFKQKLSDTLAAMDLTETVALNFPVEGLVRFGLAAWGSHWPALALDWAEALGPTDSLRRALGDLMTHGKTQEIRHRARHLFFRSGCPES